MAVSHKLPEILVRGCQQPHVSFRRPVIADAADFPLMQNAEQLELQQRADVADFVEEQRPAVGGLKQAHLVAHGAGEGPFDMAEELAFQECFGDRRAVEMNMFPDT